MSTLFPEPTFYPSPKIAMGAPRETCAYVAVLHRYQDERPDALVKVDLNPNSETYGSIIDRLDLPFVGDELHHYGWNACSSCLCPFAAHPHIERRYLIVPGIRSSRLYVIDTKDPSGKLKVAKMIDPKEIEQRTGYSRLHTVHCGPTGIYVSALGNPEGDGPGGILLLDHESFEVMGRWELDKGPQYLSYDFFWHLAQDTIITSEWGTPKMYESGLKLEQVVKGEYGHKLHFFNITSRKHVQEIDLGKEHQMVLELRPAHDPIKSYGFASVVVSSKDLSSSIWLWYKEGSKWEAKKIITIPAKPCEKELPPFLESLKAVPPLVSDIVLSVDDRFLYVSCWGTGELHQYDVTDPFRPKHCKTLAIGGVVTRKPHPKFPNQPLNGGPQMVECSRDGKHVYFTNSLYSTIDDQLYPDGLRGWMAKVVVDENGGMEFDREFFVDFGDERPHQIRLEGGDASTDSYWFS